MTEQQQQLPPSMGDPGWFRWMYLNDPMFHAAIDLASRGMAKWLRSPLHVDIPGVGWVTSNYPTLAEMAERGEWLDVFEPEDAEHGLPNPEVCAECNGSLYDGECPRCALPEGRLPRCPACQREIPAGAAHSCQGYVTDQHGVAHPTGKLVVRWHGSNVEDRLDTCQECPAPYGKHLPDCTTGRDVQGVNAPQCHNIEHADDCAGELAECWWTT